jgi:hypothetical protein
MQKLDRAAGSRRTAICASVASNQLVEMHGKVRRRTVIVWTLVAAFAATTAGILLHLHPWRPRFTTIQGAVIRRNSDTRKQQPIAGVEVTASRGVTRAVTHTDPSGYFRIDFPGMVWPGETLNFEFRRPDYQPFDFRMRFPYRSAARSLLVATMAPLATDGAAETHGHPSTVANIRIRYTVNSQKEDNIGSLVRTFQVVNRGNIPCNRKPPCSPNGSWKASTVSLSLDAGPGNEYRDVRASCIAGPCPFTRIDSSGFQQGGRTIKVTATDWSETTTFLLEAAVFHTSIGSNVRLSYPVIYDRTLNFTLPPTQEGVSIEADIDGSPMVFPLGPDLFLSWATCTERTNRETENSIVYRCELKPGYTF